MSGIAIDTHEVLGYDASESPRMGVIRVHRPIGKFAVISIDKLLPLFPDDYVTLASAMIGKHDIKRLIDVLTILYEDWDYGTLCYMLGCRNMAILGSIGCENHRPVGEDD